VVTKGHLGDGNCLSLDFLSVELLAVVLCCHLQHVTFELSKGDIASLCILACNFM
jgi:hypothetical protein